MTGQPLPAQLHEACQARGERVWECVHRSAALGRDESYTLVLPENISPKPVLIVLLHGSGRNHRTLVEQPSTRVAIVGSPSIILMPNGGASWWIAPGYQAHVIELTGKVAEAFKVDPARRGCGGWSMGAYGSIRLMEEYPGAFASWTGILGLLDFPNADYPERYNHTVPSVFGPPQQWPRRNPMHDASTLRGKRLWFATGREAFDFRMNVAFHKKLDELRIPHEFETLAGAHVFSVVAEALPQALAFHERVLRGVDAH
jgi:predicted esterase